LTDPQQFRRFGHRQSSLYSVFDYLHSL